MSTEKIEIKNLIEKVIKLDPKTYFDENYFKYIDLGSISQSKKCIEKIAPIKTNEAPSRARQLIRSNDVLVSTVRPNLNGVARISSEHDGAIASTGFCVLRPKADLLDSKYLFHWVCSYNFVRDMSHKATGASYPAVSDKIVKDSKIPLPPLDEQRQIAKILDKSNYLIDTSKNFNDLLDKLALSYFSQKVIDLCPDEKKLGDIVSFKGGGTPKKEIKEYWNGNIPWASVKDFKSNQLSTTKEYISHLGLQNSSANLIPIGTIIIPTRMALGKAAINSVELAINQDLKALIPKQKFITQYLLSALQIKKESIIKLGQGATVKGITIDVLKNVKIPFPSISEQKKISTSLEKINSLKKISQKSEKRSKEIKDSILMGFFQG